MSIVITQEMFITRMQNINPNIIVVGTYQKNNIPIQFKCKICNHTWFNKPVNLLSGTGCPNCNKKLYRTNDEFIEEMNIINPNILILSEFINTTTKVKCKCKIDDHEWEATPNNLLRGRGCDICSRLNKNKKIFAMDKSTYLKTLSTKCPNIILISDFVDMYTKVKCKCKIDGYEWYTFPNSLLYGVGCYKCSGRTRVMSEESFIKIMSVINPNIQFLSNYINMKTKILCKCKIDNNEWYGIPRHLIEGQGCPICAIDRITGENNYMWKGGLTLLNNYIRRNISDWRKDSMKAHNYKCIITNKEFDVIHHLYSFNQIITETLDILHMPVYKDIGKYTDVELKSIVDVCLSLHYKYGLGVCITNKEHKLFHKLYGLGNNTPEQFEEFKNKRLQELQIHKNIA